MLRRLLALLCVLAAVASCSQAEGASGTLAEPASDTTIPPTRSTAAGNDASTDWHAVAQRHADDLAANMAAGGAIVGIWRNGALHLASAGDQPDGTPIPPDGPWRIGSITKTFVATTMLRLVDEGAIDLDAPAASYLSEPEIPESVSVRDLLGHTSGIFNYTDDVSFFPSAFADLQRSWDPTAIVVQALELSDVAPDPAWAYSNTNYLILGLLIEEVTGGPVSSALAELTTNRGLDSTYLEGAETGPAPVGAFTFFPGQETPVDSSFPYTSTASGAWTAGAMVSDAADLMRFLRALLNGELISEAGMRQMLDMGIEGYGLGILRVQGVRTEMYGHNGGTVGYLSHASFAPSADVGVVIGLTADRPPPGLDVSIQQLIVAALTG